MSEHKYIREIEFQIDSLKREKSMLNRDMNAMRDEYIEAIDSLNIALAETCSEKAELKNQLEDLQKVLDTAELSGQDISIRPGTLLGIIRTYNSETERLKQELKKDNDSLNHVSQYLHHRAETFLKMYRDEVVETIKTRAQLLDANKQIGLLRVQLANEIKKRVGE